nr:RHS repeat-associated core domain-containing protein [Wenzhouxiangella sp. XN24]
MTLYGSALYERREAGLTVEHTHHVQANGRTVATVKRSGASTTNTTRYLHKDHLGSVVVITGETGTIVESLAYDAWGKRRPASTWQTPAPGVFIAAITLTRGFTMHEHLDQVGLIHMGGRVYDPEIGRFLSPDPFVQFPISTQGFNRYAYVGNNPLFYTDPSGYFLKKQTPTPVVFIVALSVTRGFTGHEHLDQVGLVHGRSMKVRDRDDEYLGLSGRVDEAIREACHMTPSDLG